MLEPSYTQLMKQLNEDQIKGKEITSRYSIVLVAANRARQLIAGEEQTTTNEVNKPLSIAIKEMSENNLKIEMNLDIEEIVD